MMKDQVIDAFVAALLWEGVTHTQIEAAMSRVERLRLGEDLSSGSDEVRNVAQAMGQRFRAVKN